MSSKSTVLLVGLPGSGKTTFLAALWHQVESSEISTAFKAEKLQPDREYLNRISETWLGLEEIPRTALGMQGSALLHLRHVSTQQDFDLFIPDVAGETYSAQWIYRRATKDYVQHVRDSFGILLFVHCRQVTPVELLREPNMGLSPAIPGADLTEWDPKSTPTQVQLVDIIQSARRIYTEKAVMRIAVMVSAWDEVEEKTIPDAWMERKLPLLDQFLKANGESISSQCFGISAIGGRLEDRDRLALARSPSSRVQVHIGTNTENDLTLPLEFLTVDEKKS